MGNDQSRLGTVPSAPAAKEAHSLSPPIGIPIIVPGGLKAFTLFSKLHLELQVEIWTLVLDQATSRVIKATYNMTSNLYSYKYAMPTLMVTCRLSRQIAQRKYISLLHASFPAVYFNPALDFLYCTSIRDLPYARNREEVNPVISFLKSSPIASNIRVLILDSSYWIEQVHEMLSVPDFAAMPELHLLAGLEKLFLVVPSLEQELANKRRIYEAVVTNNIEWREQRLEGVSVVLAKHDAEAPNSIVPGFRVYSMEPPFINKSWELARAFGMTTLPFSGSGWGNSDFEPLCDLGRLPKCIQIRHIFIRYCISYE